MDLMANELDVGSCWCQSHLRFSKEGKSSEDVIKNILCLEDNYRIVGMLSLGIPTKKPEEHKLSEIDETKIEYVQ
jgi:nitroreductase